MPRGRFPTTQWSLIRRAGDGDDGARRRALDELCRAYWYPVYAFLRLSAGGAEEAADLTQGFFADLIRRDSLADVDPGRGSRFRSWLLGCAKHFVSTERVAQRRQKRGGGQVLESLDAALAEQRYHASMAHDLTPERMYQRAFAEEVLRRALARLRARYVEAGQEARFEALKWTLPSGAAPRPYEEIARELEMKVATVRQEASRLRERFRQALFAEVRELMDPDPDAPAGAHPDRDPDAPAPAPGAVEAEVASLLEAIV